MKNLELIETKNYHGQPAKFYVRPGNATEIINDVRIRNFYLDKGFGVFSPGDIVIDIGAHIGAFAIECAIRGATVLAFEPDPENFAILKKNIEANDFENIISAYDTAVSNFTGIAELYKDSKNNGSHSLLKGCIDNGISGSVKVKTISLDDILKDYLKIKLIKLDCEGAEYGILESSDLDKVEKIVCELHNRDKSPGLVKHLEKSGFEVTWHYGKRLGKLQGVKKNTV